MGLAACVFENKLCVFYRDANSCIHRTAFDGNAWSEPVDISDINGARTSGSVTAFAVGNEMDVIYRSADGDDLIYTFSALPRGHMSGQRILIHGTTSAGVGVSGFGNGVVRLIYKDDTGGAFWTQEMLLD